MMPRLHIAQIVRAAAAGALLLVAELAAAQTPLATAIKATYLYKFAPFVAWPATAFETPSSPLVICIVGQDPFDGMLDQAIAGQHIGGRPIVLRRIAAPSPACHVAFIAGDERFVAASLEAMRDAPVLTVTDGASRAHGIINFIIDANHVRFDVDDDMARRSGLAISSKLLTLAHAVVPRG